MAERRVFGLLLLLYLFSAFAYSQLIPSWEGPDEPAHYILALNLARIGVFSTLERNYEAHQPQTYYRIAQFPLRWLYLQDRDSVAYYRPPADYGNVRKPAPIFEWTAESYRFLPGLFVLRMLNILFGAGALLLNYAGLRYFVSGRVALSAVIFAGFIPQYLHTVSTVNNDAFGILIGAFLFWLVVRLDRGGTSPALRVASFPVVVILPFVSKLTVLPVSLAVICAWLIDIGYRQRTRMILLISGSIVTLGVFAIVFSRLEPGLAEQLGRELVWRAFAVRPDAFSAGYLSEVVSQIVWSFWGKVGWLAVGLPGSLVGILTLLALGGAVANFRVVFLRTRDGDLSEPLIPKAAWIFPWLAVLFVLAAVIKNGLVTINSQGRFLFPALGPMALIIVSGWDRLLPDRFRRFLFPGLFLLMLLINLVLIIGGILPVYYQPFLD